MTVSLIWIVVIAICLVPLTLLFRANPRAVPLGFFIVGGIMLFGIGALGIGGSGYQPNRNVREVIWLWALVLVVMAVLAVLNLIWLRGSALSRAGWLGMTWVVWTFVFLVLDAGLKRADRVKAAAMYEIEKKEMADPNSEYSKIKALYDRPAPPQAPVLEQIINAAAADIATHPFRPGRFVYFGDPKKPETVSIWGVMNIDSSRVFGREALRSGSFFLHVNLAAKDLGLRVPISVGITTEELIAAAGGDSAYFGVDGSRVVPQYDRMRSAGSAVADLSPPVIRQ